jgi:hypothetical protein
LNGPKLCLPDWVEIDVGVERDFNGLAAAWVAQLNMGNNTSVGEIAPYKPVTIARDSGLGWNKGRTVILLDDAEGNTWIMKGFELGLKPQYTYDEFWPPCQAFTRSSRRAGRCGSRRWRRI